MSKVIGEIETTALFGQKMQVVRTGKENPRYPLSVRAENGLCIPLLSAKGQDLILSNARIFSPDKPADEPVNNPIPAPVPDKTAEPPATPEQKFYKPAFARQRSLPDETAADTGADEWGF